MTRRTPAARTKTLTTAEAIRAQSVLLEQLGSQMALVLESVTASRAEMDAKMTALEERLSQRIAILEEAVRGLAADNRGIRAELSRLGDQVTRLSDEVARLRYDFDHREERGRLDALDVRVAALEARLGIASR